MEKVTRVLRCGGILLVSKIGIENPTTSIHWKAGKRKNGIYLPLVGCTVMVPQLALHQGRSVRQATAGSYGAVPAWARTFSPSGRFAAFKPLVTAVRL